ACIGCGVSSRGAKERVAFLGAGFGWGLRGAGREGGTGRSAERTAACPARVDSKTRHDRRTALAEGIHMALSYLDPRSRAGGLRSGATSRGRGFPDCILLSVRQIPTLHPARQNSQVPPFVLVAGSTLTGIRGLVTQASAFAPTSAKAGAAAGPCFPIGAHGRRRVMVFCARLTGALLGVLTLIPCPAGVRSCFPQPALCAAPLAADTNEAAQAADPDEEAEIQANLAKLPQKDRKLAEEQKFCAVADDSRLGAMGVPVKILIKNQPVFLCCKACTKQAEKDADKTLA